MPTISKAFFLFLFISNISLGQNCISKKIKGKISADSNDLEGIYVINLKTELTALTEKGGYFEINATEGDTLMFSSVQFKAKKVNLKKEDFNGDLLFVKLEILIHHLENVQVQQFKNINAVALGIISPNTKHFTPAERKLNAASNSYLKGNTDGTSGVSFSADPLLNMLSGRTAMLEKEVEVEKKETLLDKINDLFDEDYFATTLKIPQDYIKGFLYYIVEDNNFTKAMNAKNKTMATFVMNDLAVKYVDLLNQK